MVRTYIAIDLKSFYASVECADRKLDPLRTNLVVADMSRTEKTICLAVSPSLKANGVPGRPRLFEVIEKVKLINEERLQVYATATHNLRATFSSKSHNADALDADPSLELSYIVAPPRMNRYMEISSQIYGIYLKYVSEEDVIVYSIDEVFIDVTPYMKTYHMTAKELAMTMIREVLYTTGITATAGIGTNASLEDLFADLWGDSSAEEPTPMQAAWTPETVEDHTLMTDQAFLDGTVRVLAETHPYKVMPLHDAEGLEIRWTQDMQRRFRNVLPPEATPAVDAWLMVSPDKAFVARENRKSLQNALEEDTWPKVHYLWRQHPIMQWAGDKAGQFFGRQEAPLIGSSALTKEEVIFCMAGSIPNRRATPLVDEWFAVRFVDGRFDQQMTMEELLQRTGFNHADLPNPALLTEEDADAASHLLSEAVNQAKEHLRVSALAYINGPYEQIYPELAKLEELKERHLAHLDEKYEQLNFIGSEKRKDAEQRHIDQIFQDFFEWVNESMDIDQEHPYIRVIAAFMGVNA